MDTASHAKRWHLVLLWLGIFLAGVIVGGYLFRDVRARSFLAVDRCQQRCIKANELAGLLASAGIQRLGASLPNVLFESEKSVVVKYPFSEAKFHAVVFPKKDITDIADLTAEDAAYLQDALAVIGQMVRENGLKRYRVLTNGQNLQQVRLLHFHLIAND